jgi:hypothetical protein
VERCEVGSNGGPSERGTGERGKRRVLGSGMRGAKGVSEEEEIGEPGRRMELARGVLQRGVGRSVGA